jgi:putative protease
MVEVLSPAGSFESLKAAVKGKADAIYIGAEKFSARAFAENFAGDRLKAAVEYCHENSVKTYVAMNTLVTDREMPDWLKLAERAVNFGADALIAADLGAAMQFKARFPEIPLHASTQMSVHSKEGADALAALGFSRVVLARECNARQIREICKSNIEIEVFVHGAFCVSHSGQCLFSSMVGGRSGNRGECAQPCRLPYNKGKYLLSLKDNCLAGHITELCESGVSSLKIEGRMKSPVYVYGVTKTYRRLVDEHRNTTNEELSYLEKLFSRQGFTDAYYTGRVRNENMSGIRIK